MLRRAVIAALAAASIVAPAAAADPVALMPGVTYERQVTLTQHGPVVLHVLIVPRPGGLYELRPALANDAVPGREKLTSIAARAAAGATVVGIAGDFFRPDGRPAGLLVRGGALEHAPRGDRVSVGFDSSGALRAGRVRLFATYQGTGQRRALTGLNEPPGGNGVALYTAAWGSATPDAPGSVELVLDPFRAPAPTGETAGPVVQVAGGGGTPIPPDGAVLVARGTAAQSLRDEAGLGVAVTVRTVTAPDWSGVGEALGGGPLLVREGVPVFRPFEAFAPDLLARRTARGAVGQRADGSLLLVTVDGGRPGYSVGMTSLELAQALVRLGAVTAAGLAGADAATMAFGGELLSRPSGPAGEQPVAEGLLVLYTGVAAAPPAADVLSPNGDGVGEEQTLSYRVVRPSSVTESLVAPDGTTRLAQTLQREPGTYTVTWNGRTAEGAVELEGRWRFVVAATDDRGQTSQDERDFALDTTLGSLAPVAGALRTPQSTERPVATYTLTRAASVAARVETVGGTVVRSLGARRLDPGPQTVTWNGDDDAGRPVASGRYVVRVTARSEVGASSLAAPVSVRHARR